MLQLIGVKSNYDIEIRQKFSIVPSRFESNLKRFKEIVDEIIIISTCNRTEIYINSQMSYDELINSVFYNFNWDKYLISYTFYKEGKDVVTHLMEVICGFDSKILGEEQILGQIKTAYTLALKNNSIKGELQRLFQEGIACSKNFRQYCEIYKIPVSSASIVVKEALKEDIKRFMIIGFGETGRLVLKYLLSYEIDIVYVVVRDKNNIKNNSIIDEKVRFINFEDKNKFYNEVDSIVSCTSAPHTIIHREELPEQKSILIFDLAVPKDVDKEVVNLRNIRVLDIDDISSMDNNNKIMRRKKMEKYKYILDEHIDKFITWQSINELSPEIQYIKNFGEEVNRERIKTFKNKKNTKDHEELAETLIKSTSKVYINRFIEVLKEEKLEGREKYCLEIMKKIFC